MALTACNDISHSNFNIVCRPVLSTDHKIRNYCQLRGFWQARRAGRRANELAVRCEYRGDPHAPAGDMMDVSSKCNTASIWRLLGDSSSPLNRWEHSGIHMHINNTLTNVVFQYIFLPPVSQCCSPREWLIHGSSLYVPSRFHFLV